MSGLLEPRHVWKKRAADAGLSVAFGGALPPGRRLRVRVTDGQVVADSDESARWRGRVLLRETPADLSPAARAAVHAVAVQLAPPASDVELEVVWDGETAIVVGAHLADVALIAVTGVEIVAAISAQRAYRGPLTEVVTVAGMACDLSHGQNVEVAAGACLATITVSAATRTAALALLSERLASVRLSGPLSDLMRLHAALPLIRQGLASARDLEALASAAPAVEVLAPGLLTTVQDWPGRCGYWDVGVPPSGPFDELAFRLANRLVGNHTDAAGLELTLIGPTLRFLQPTIICLSGCQRSATLDGQPLLLWRPVAVPAGSVVVCGAPSGDGVRGYLAVRHGIDVPTYLGSRATFDLGGFGGHAGRGLAAGDHLPLMRASAEDELAACPLPLGLPVAARPLYQRAWSIAVLEGPHAAPEFFTPDDMAMLYAQPWAVHHNSNRTGVRLVGPKPQWARRDGGEAGLHPSNIHDNAYAIGAIDFTGDMPILLGPDGPSLGGFVCPAVVVSGERWKLGQLRPGDTVNFVRVTPTQAQALASEQERLVRELTQRKISKPIAAVVTDDAGAAIIYQRPGMCVRRAGDCYLLVEYGEPELDLGLRLRVHQLWQAVRAAAWPELIDLTPGIRSLQFHFDPLRLSQAELVQRILALDGGLPPITTVEVPMRTVHLPLSWDDPATRKAIEIYMRTVNATAPWCPSNLEFIRRINGLESLDEVQRIVFDAEYLVLGLGDVYLGAPVATPLDPRHRLVTTKYNPARTWTPQNAVGIGGAYMCIYGMEGPGGYQFVGRTVPVWDTWGSEPCLLRFFDRIRFFPVSHDELMRLRSAPYHPRTEDGVFKWADYQVFLQTEAAPIAAFRATQRSAFAAERQRWNAS